MERFIAVLAKAGTEETMILTGMNLTGSGRREEDF
jgi:hypothetical protein